MKKSFIVITIIMIIAVLGIIVFQDSSEAQRPDRGNRQRRNFPGGFVRQNPLESSWAYVSFDLKISDDALLKARKVYQEAWIDQAKATKKMQESDGDMTAMQNLRSEMDRIEKVLAEKLSDILTPEQMQKLNKWKEENQEQQQQMRRPPSPPGM
ncbi:hypothetical protein GF312_15935 [Candidatus Poribacteria bacterium]|nr:hypothetical protein [Candidatus Poribacteria bacterium]